MRNRRTALALAAVVASGIAATAPGYAQEADDQTEAAVVAVTDALDEPEPELVPSEEIDALMAPVALFPDSVLAQIFMASTYPLDVVKAGRFVTANADLPDKERADAVEKTDWDPSVQALAAGFPDLITRMNDHIDWTEQVGDLVLVQTDDVFDSIQRLRAEAAETGYLSTNDAQTVSVSLENEISIAPTNPEVVYVPTYDPQVVYTQPAPQQVVYVDDNSGTDWGQLITNGAIIFGTAMILDEIFDDDDPWDDYWREPSHVNWNKKDFNSRPNVTVNGDVNIGNNNNNNVIDRDKIKIDRDKMKDRDRIRVEDGKIGNIDRTKIDQNVDRKFNPDEVKRNEAKAKLAERQKTGQRPATLPASTGTRESLGAGSVAAPDKIRPAKVNKPVAVERPAKPQATREVAKPAAIARPAKAKPATKVAPKSSTVFEKSGGSRAGAASARGKASAKKRSR